MFRDDQKTALSADLSRTAVKSRPQAGRQLSYIEGWHVIAECNRIFGFDAWDRETVDLRQLGDAREVDGKWRVAYMAKVRATVRAGDSVIVRDGCGFGSGIDRDQGQAHESALKEAETDAMKRALMTFGNPFGLALYDKEQRNVGDGQQETQASQQNIVDLKEVAEYAAGFRARLQPAETSADVQQIFREESGRMRSLGITKGTKAYADIVAECEEASSRLDPSYVRKIAR